MGIEAAVRAHQRGRGHLQVQVGALDGDEVPQRRKKIEPHEGPIGRSWAGLEFYSGSLEKPCSAVRNDEGAPQGPLVGIVSVARR